MTTNTTILLNLPPPHRRHIRGMVATLTLASDLGRCELGTKVRAVRDALAKALLPGATFDTIVRAKYLLNDCTGYAHRVIGGDTSDCLYFVADAIQEVFDQYSGCED